MRLVTRVVSVGAVGALMGAFSVVPAHATTVDRGTTQILTCNNVASLAQAKDSTGHGLDLSVRNLKISAIAHAEKDVPGTATYTKSEPDPATNDHNGDTIADGTPDIGDTDSCTGTLTTTSGNPWIGVANNPNGPTQPANGTGTQFNEIMGIAGALNGRATCDTALVDPSEYSLHGKLTIKFGEQASVGTPLTVQALDGLAKGLASQVYVNNKTIPGFLDVVSVNGIGIKGTAEGAWFDAQLSFRSPAYYGAAAAEACAFGVDLDANTVIGEAPAGGLIHLALDTDVDTDAAGGPTADANYNNSMDWSV